MKTILLLLMVLVGIASSTVAQSISEIFGNDLTDKKIINFHNNETNVWLSYYPEDQTDSVPPHFFIKFEEQRLSCEVYDDGTIKKAYIERLEEGNGAIDDPDVLISVEVVNSDLFITSHLIPLIQDFLANWSSYTRIEYPN